MSFSKDFLWGAATASAQIEGGWNEDGRTPSIWDLAPEGKIKNSETCHEACDHYHLYKEDVQLMKELGLKSYRFSISWSRIVPKEGEVNEKGIAFYNDLIDELLKNGIEPLVTLYHWDLPAWVQEKGGWLSKNIIMLFEQYTRIIVDAYSDRVTYWIPMNEPQCFIMNGHMTGNHAPFMKKYLSLPRLTENCLMAFHASVRIIRALAKKTPKVGIAMATSVFIPEKENEEGIRQAYEDSFSKGSGLMNNLWWAAPLLEGRSVRAFGIYKISDKYLPSIKTKLDFIGINTYAPFTNNWYGKDDSLPPERKNSLGWVNDGRCLYWTIRFWSERYHLPILVTENGMCDEDRLNEDLSIHDEKRIGFMKDYLAHLKRAVDEGYDVLGYEYWSLMDNFEWAEGYGPRFGLIYVDFKTKDRYLKDSASYYQKVIASNGEDLD
ncbi:MAG: family 1 glycosylhydrolase [Erysipelotrichaceae bacterium]|nr:family 1 glycosylhydrolase [Erysipelotrichaceae bacterium]